MESIERNLFKTKSISGVFKDVNLKCLSWDEMCEIRNDISLENQSFFVKLLTIIFLLL